MTIKMDTDTLKNLVHKYFTWRRWIDRKLELPNDDGNYLLDEFNADLESAGLETGKELAFHQALSAFVTETDLPESTIFCIMSLLVDYGE